MIGVGLVLAPQRPKAHSELVLDAPPDSRLFASHLGSQGFYLLRALVQLNEVAKVLSV